MMVLQAHGEYGFGTSVEALTDDEIMRVFLTPQSARFAGPISYPYPRKEVISVACGANHLLVLARNRGEGSATLYSSGLNSYGQLGLPEDINMVHELTEVRERVGLIAAGDYHSYFVDIDGHFMYGCGANDYAQLGLGHVRSPQFGAQQIKFPHPVVITKIAAGGSHGMALDANNFLYTWGNGNLGGTGHARNARGEVGGDMLRATKLDLNSEKTVLDFAGGGQFSAVVLSENDYEEVV